MALASHSLRGNQAARGPLLTHTSGPSTSTCPALGSVRQTRRARRERCRANPEPTKSLQRVERYPHGTKHVGSGEITMDSTIEGIRNLSVTEMTSASKYLKPYSAFYNMNGRDMRWDMIKSLPSVGIVLYHTEWDAFLLVRQFRPAVYACDPTDLPLLEEGFTYEVCAGLLDKEKSILDTCKAEIEEECGYKVCTEDIVPVTTYIGSAGNSGAVHNLFAAKVDESMRLEDSGGGLQHEGEAIELLALPRDCSEEFLADFTLPKSAGLVAGISWALLQLERGSW